MARALAYQLEFISEVYKHNHLVEIWEEGYIGSVTKLRMGAPGLISKRDRDGGVYGTSMELKLESTLDSQLIKLYTADATKFLVMHYRNNVLVQSGFIVPEQYSEEYIAPPYDIAVLVTDGLGILKEKKYTYYGRHTVLEVLKYCLDSTGLNLDFDIVCDLREAGVDPARSVLAQITVDGEKWRDRTIYEALSELSATFRAYITQYNGRWRFARFADLLADSMIYTNSLSYLISIPNQVRKLGSLSNDLYPIGNLTFQIDPAYKSAKFTRTYDKRVSFFENPDFKMLDGWDVATTASTQMFRDKNYVVLRSLPSGEEISQTINVEASTRTFNFEISYFKLSLRPLSFTVALKLTAASGQVQWLGKEGWQGAEERFDMVADAENDLETIYNTTSPYNIQTIQQSGTIKFETIPADGELTLYIRAQGPSSVGTDEAARSKFCITDALLTTEVEKGLTVDAILNSGNIAAGDTEIFFGDSDVGDNASLILSNYFKRTNGQPTAVWKVGSAGAEDSFFNTMVRDYVVYYGLPKRILSGYVMGEHLQVTQCLLDKYADTYMYIDTMTVDVYADQAEVSAYELLPHLEIIAVNEDVAPEEFPRVIVSYTTLPDGSRVKTYTVASSGSAYKRVTSRDKAELTLEEILKIKSRANYSNALAALAQKKADTANLIALEASQSADDALLRLNNIVNNSIVSVEEKAGLLQLIDRLSGEMLLYASDNNNKGADITALQDAFTALLDFLSTVVLIASNEATELTPAQVEQYSTLFADFYAKRSVFTTDVSTIRAELLSYTARISDIDKDKSRVTAEYNSTSEAQGLTTTLLQALTTAKNEYFAAHTVYKNLLLSIIADDKITAEERASAGVAFVAYSTKLSNFNIAVESAKKSITDAIGTTLESWVADGVISPLEKLAIKQTRAQVLSEKESLIADAGVYDISTTAYVTAWTAYDTALAKYSAEEPEIITVDTDFASSESAYKSAKVALKTAITNAQKSDTGEKHPKGGAANLDMTVKNLVAVGYVGFYGGVSGGSTPASSLLDLSDIDATTASAVVGSPLVKLGNGKWGPGSVSIDLTNYFTKAESDARFAFKSHSHDYVTPTAFNAHTGDTTKHITSAERSAWNAKEGSLGNPDTNGKILASTTSGVRSWVSRYVLPVATAAVLGGVMIGSNISVNAQGVISVAAPYSHPATHPASMITESTTRRFITDTERANWNDSYDKRHTHGNKANLDSINQNLSQTSNVKFNDIVADGSIGFYGGVGSGSTPVASLLDLSDIDASISTAVTGTPLVKLSNGKWGAGSVSIDLSNYYNKSDADARYAFKSHSHDYVTTSAFNGHTHSWEVITGKPVTFAPSAHNHYQVFSSSNAPSAALLVNNRSDDEAGSAWIYWDGLGGTSSPWGIKHNQPSNYIEFYGNGNIRAYVDLNSGSGRVLTTSDISSNVAAYSHTHSYLPLSGGIMSNSIKFGYASGTMIYSNSMSDMVGWDLNHGTYIGSNVNGYNEWIYGNGKFISNGTLHTLLHSGNYNSYSPTLTGGGATGTWGINITGNATSATSANNAEKLRSYYPTGNIDLNTYLHSGGALWYYGQGATMANTPSWFTYGSIYQLNSTTNDSLSLQIATSTLHDTTTPSYKIGWRMSNNLGWQNDWKEIYHSGNLNKSDVAFTASQITLNNLTGGYIPYADSSKKLINSPLWTNTIRVESSTAFRISSLSENADASLHIRGSFGGFDRLTQISPIGNSKHALNLMASTNSSGGEDWWVWGVKNSIWRTHYGTSFSGDGGLSIQTNGNADIGYGGTRSEKLAVNGSIYSASTMVASSYIQAAYYKLGNWEIKQNASGELEFILSGALKFKITSTGIVSSGGLAFYS